MSHWTAIPIPPVAERIIAFTIPDCGRFFVVSYEGVHKIVLDPEIVVTSDVTHPKGDGVFNGERLMREGQSHPTLGLHGGTAIIVDDSGAVLELEPEGDNGVVNVLRSDGELIQSLSFLDYSGDWQRATFASDYRHIIIGTPYTITVYRRSL